MFILADWRVAGKRGRYLRENQCFRAERLLLRAPPNKRQVGPSPNEHMDSPDWPGPPGTRIIYESEKSERNPCGIRKHTNNCRHRQYQWAPILRYTKVGTTYVVISKSGAAGECLPQVVGCLSARVNSSPQPLSRPDQTSIAPIIPLYDLLPLVPSS